MAVQIFANNVFTTLQGAIGAGDTIITVPSSDEGRFPSPSGGDWFLVTVEDNVNLEIMKCTDRTGNVLTVVRNQESTGAYAFPNGSRVDMRVTASSLAQFVQPAALVNYVGGPLVATNNALVRWDLTTGKLVKDSNATLDDSGNMVIAGSFHIDNATSRAGMSFASTTTFLGSVSGSPNVSMRVNNVTVGAWTSAGLQSTNIGGVAPGTGAFTTLAASGTSTLGVVNSGAIVSSGTVTANQSFLSSANQWIGANASAGSMFLRPVGVGSATGQLVLSSAGDVTVNGALTPSGLLDISGAAAGQIKFPATQNPSANANTFDDYEEGTYTCTIVGTTAAGTGTYSENSGSYTKLGQRVLFEQGNTWSAHTGTGNMILDGLPFAQAATPVGGAPCVTWFSSITFATIWQAFVAPSATTITLHTVGTGAGAVAIPMDTAGTIRASGHYKV